MGKNYIIIDGRKVFVSEEMETYSMENGLGDVVAIIEDYGNDKSYCFFNGKLHMYEDATRASNDAFKRGFRE